MALTKQQIFEALQPKKKSAAPTQPHKPKPDNFADLVTRLKSKGKPPVNPD